MAERSKALRQGRNLFGGVGSNPTLVTVFCSLCQSRASTYKKGGVAQMVERSLSMREVQGSIPCISNEQLLQHDEEATVV